jgi:hypothetical protein
MTFEAVLQAVRAELTARSAPGREWSREMALALDAYVRAHEARIAAEFAERNALPVLAAPGDVTAAALALRDLVAALPELAATGAAAALEPAATPTAGAPEPSPVRRETMEIPTLEEAQRTLAKEFDTAPFASMRLDEFKLCAEEFAAAARALQERTGGDPLSQRVIRRLTALVHERELPRKVFGLSRAHVGDWQRLANEARARRLKAVGRDPRVA